MLVRCTLNLKLYPQNRGNVQIQQLYAFDLQFAHCSGKLGFHVMPKHHLVGGKQSPQTFPNALLTHLKDFLGSSNCSSCFRALLEHYLNGPTEIKALCVSSEMWLPLKVLNLLFSIGPAISLNFFRIQECLSFILKFLVR